MSDLLILPGPTLAHAAMTLLWFAQREDDERMEGWR